MTEVRGTAPRQGRPPLPALAGVQAGFPRVVGALVVAAGELGHPRFLDPGRPADEGAAPRGRKSSSTHSPPDTEQPDRRATLPPDFDGPDRCAAKLVAGAAGL
jgi:hypothetical protein